MSVEKRIDYIEIPVPEPVKARDFFAALFDWPFQEWGSDYISFNDGRLEGGFRRSETPTAADGVLVVFFSEDLKRDRERVLELGATITHDIFSFPGGRRFQFVDPAGTQYAFWSTVKDDEQQ